MPRSTQPPELLDAWLPPRVGRNARRERLTDLIDWGPLEALVADRHAAPVGRPSYPPLLMVKVLLLQPWCRASDPALEEAWWERLSFRAAWGGAAGRRAGSLDEQPLPPAAGATAAWPAIPPRWGSRCWPTTCAAPTACWPARPPSPRRRASSPCRGAGSTRLHGRPPGLSRPSPHPITRQRHPSALRRAHCAKVSLGGGLGV